ncbi:hypothetical protein BO86DRAFT_383254 [Aspergillus japonicus CBS 114.51]|uniref:Uncharacterized protein n=1 Tax=Aspergillus japonicus CBS 114.51 TaxID=1448312 RepID=A0A8T8WNB0_ASPJA|nr:hypothetical protein BO86DRAFT_383254 [Aspergillus japonicus CBS 114.51]RAH77174.1 hypothetical protein BO86DRAFT_383254 [Aspergillus japonicus CBS 114.51]
MSPPPPPLPKALPSNLSNRNPKAGNNPSKMVRLAQPRQVIIPRRHHPLEQYVWLKDHDAGRNDPSFTPDWNRYRDELTRQFRRLRSADPRLKPLIGEVHVGRRVKVYKELRPSGQALCVQWFLIGAASEEREHARTMQLVEELWGPDEDVDSEAETVVVPLDVQGLRISEER